MTCDSLAYLFLIIFGAFISAVAQVLLKKSASLHFSSKIREYLNPMVITAYMVFFVATLCVVFAYKRIPLSLGPIFESSSYIYVTLFGCVVFHETINRKKIMALSLIVIGIIIASF